MPTGAAFAMIEQFLRDSGLQALIPFLSQSFVDGMSIEEATLQLEQRPEYRTRFKAVFDRRQQIQEQIASQGFTNLAPIAAVDVIGYERQARGLEQFYGLPVGFVDVQQALVRDVSFDEMRGRISSAAADFQRAKEDPYYAQAIRELQDFYGEGDGNLIAFFADPDLAGDMLQRRRAEANVLAASTRTGFDMTAEERQLFTGRIADPESAFGQNFALGEIRQDVARRTQLEAMAGDAAAVQQIETARRRRQTPFEEGGGFASDQSGVVGLR